MEKWTTHKRDLMGVFVHQSVLDYLICPDLPIYIHNSSQMFISLQMEYSSNNIIRLLIFSVNFLRMHRWFCHLLNIHYPHFLIINQTNNIGCLKVMDILSTTLVMITGRHGQLFSNTTSTCYVCTYTCFVSTYIACIV